MLRSKLGLLKIKATAGTAKLKTQTRQHVCVTVTQQGKKPKQTATARESDNKAKDTLNDVNAIYSTAILWLQGVLNRKNALTSLHTSATCTVRRMPWQLYK